MQIRTGIDAVRIQRGGLMSDSFVNRYFHPEEKERAAALTGDRRNEFLASRFAVKEAFLKAAGCGVFDAALCEILCSSTKEGQPVLKLYGSALKLLQNCGKNPKVSVSITHEEPLAIAIVQILTED